MNEETRVLLLSPSLDLRGTTVHTRNLVRALKDRGYKFHVVAHQGTLARAIAAEGAVVHPFAVTPGINTWLNLHRLNKLITHLDPHIIHVRHHTLTNLLRPILWRHPRPLIISVSTPPAAGPLPLPGRHTRAVLAVSDPLAEDLVANHRVPRSLLSTVRDATFLDPEPPPLPEGTNPIVGYMGRIETDRGVDLIPGIARRVVERLPDVRFALCGEGKDDLRLRRLIRKSGMAKYIHVSPPPADYRRLIASFHMLLSPAIKEGLGIFALEAMALGRPVVAAAVGGVYAHVKDGRTGLLVRPGDESDIARGIIELIEAPEVIQAMGMQGRDLVAREFQLEELAGEMDQIYRHALAFRPEEMAEDLGR